MRTDDSYPVTWSPPAFPPSPSYFTSAAAAPLPMPPGPPSSFEDRLAAIGRKADYWQGEAGIARRDRDSAKAEIQRAREATVWAMDARAKDSAELTRLTEVVAKQQGLIRDAEQKTADLGWRKNRLLDAIAARGLVVTWAKDGTPTIETKEEAEAREQRLAEAAKQQRGVLSPFLDMFRQQDGMMSALLRDMERGLLFRPFISANMPTPPKPVDAVQKIEWRIETAPAKPPEPVRPAEPTAEDYYRRATKAVYGYPVEFRGRVGPSEYIGGRLDDALTAELRKHHPDDGVRCALEYCTKPQCLAWRNRPWKR